MKKKLFCSLVMAVAAIIVYSGAALALPAGQRTIYDWSGHLHRRNNLVCRILVYRRCGYKYASRGGCPDHGGNLQQ